jgi:hypothetical protein
MRRTILLSLLALFTASLAVGAATDACAQRRGGGGLGFARGGNGFGHARGVSRYGLGYGYLPYDSLYDSGAGYGDAPQPVVVVEQPPVFVQPPAPPAVGLQGHAVITEYKWPAAELAASNSALPAPSETQSFAIVLKDGSTLSAVSVFSSDDGLHYVDQDERHLRIQMSAVNRAATLELNRARNLNLYLPAAQ